MGASCIWIITVIIEFILSILSSKQAAVGKELKESNDHKKEEGNSDFDYSSSQLESSDSSVVLEIKMTLQIFLRLLQKSYLKPMKRTDLRSTLFQRIWSVSYSVIKL